MKAIVQDGFGSADVLEFRDIEDPVIGEDEVLVRVQAAGCGPGRVAPDDRAAVLRAGHAGLPTDADRRREAGTSPGVVEAVGATSPALRAGRRGDGHRRGLLRGARGRPSGQAGPQAGTAVVRAGRGASRSPGSPRSRRSATSRGPRRAARAGHRRRRRGGHAHGADRQGVRRRGHRACAARRRRSWSARSAPTTSSTTPARTSRTDAALGRDRRHGGSSLAARHSAGRSRPKGTLAIVGGDGGGRWTGGFFRQILRAPAPVAVRRPEASPGGSRRRPRRTSRRSLDLIEGGEVTPVVDTNLRAGRCRRGDPVPGAGARSRQGRRPGLAGHVVNGARTDRMRGSARPSCRVRRRHGPRRRR